MEKLYSSKGLLKMVGGKECVSLLEPTLTTRETARHVSHPCLQNLYEPVSRLRTHAELYHEQNFLDFGISSLIS